MKAPRAPDPLEHLIPPMLESAGSSAGVVITITQEGFARFRSCRTKDASPKARQALETLEAIYKGVAQGLVDIEELGEAVFEADTNGP